MKGLKSKCVSVMNQCWLGLQASRVVESLETESGDEEEVVLPTLTTETGDQIQMDELKFSSICDLLLSCDKSWRDIFLDEKIAPRISTYIMLFVILSMVFVVCFSIVWKVTESSRAFEKVLLPIEPSSTSPETEEKGESDIKSFKEGRRDKEGASQMKPNNEKLMTGNEGTVKRGEEKREKCSSSKNKSGNKWQDRITGEEDDFGLHERFKYPSHRLPSSAPASVRATPDKLLDTISERNFRFLSNLNPIDNDSPAHSYHQSSTSLRHQLPVHSIPRRPYQLPLSATMSQLYRPHDYYSVTMRPSTSGDPGGSGEEEVMTRSMRNSSSLSRITHQSSFPPHSAPSSIRARPSRIIKRYDSYENRVEENDNLHEGTDHEESPMRESRTSHRTKGDSASMYSSSDSPSKYSQYYQPQRGYGHSQRDQILQETQFHPPHEFQYPSSSITEVHSGTGRAHSSRDHYEIDQEIDYVSENKNFHQDKEGNDGDGVRRRSRSSQRYPHQLTPSEAAFLLESRELEEMRRRLEASVSHLETSSRTSGYGRDITGSVPLRTPEYNYNNPYYYEPNVRQSRNLTSLNKYPSDRDIVPLLETTATPRTSQPQSSSYNSSNQTGVSSNTQRAPVRRQSSMDKPGKIIEPVVVHPVITSHRHKFHRRSYAQPMITSSIRSGSTDQLMKKQIPENNSNLYSRKSVTAASFLNPNPSSSSYTESCPVVATNHHTDPMSTGSSRPPSSHK